MKRPLMLDSFGCAAIGAEGYRNAGFEVVVLDKESAPLKHARAAGFETVQRDALKALADPRFLGQFDFIHASPPCQGYSATRQLAVAQGKGQGRAVNLVPEVRALLEAWAGPWVIENVPRSPLKTWPGVAQVCGSSFGLKAQRHRLFAGSMPLVGTVCQHQTFDVDPISGKPRPWGVYYAKGDNIPSGGRTCLTSEHAHECMGLTSRTVPWKYLCEGLPPVFTEFIGRQVMEVL